MGDAQLRRGNQADHAFGAEGFPWFELAVVDLHIVEEISRPFEARITLAHPAAGGPIALDSLVDRPAALAVADGIEQGFHLRHGIVAEAEEVDRAGDVYLYRVLLVPHLFRARYRRRCRTFVDQTLKNIVSSVLANATRSGSEGPGGLSLLTEEPVFREVTPALEGEPPEARALFLWDLRTVEGAERIEDPRLRPYVVQYNESDLDFVSRLLGEEGIAYVFEHTVDAVVLRLTDRPGLGGSEALTREHVLQGRIDGLDAAAAAERQVLRSFREARRLRSRTVTMRDYDWPRSGILLEARSSSDGAEDASVSLDHFEFPARDETTAQGPCAFPARVRLERFETERRLAHGDGTVRSMRAGRRFRMLEADGHPRGEHVVVRIETVATQHHFPGTSLDSEPFGFDGRSSRQAPSFATRFEVVAAEVPYRPPAVTPGPRIDGVQTAVVTQHEGQAAGPPEIHCDDWGQVRVRFPWDQRDDGTPSSTWIRVSQGWAGAGFGAVFTPRVGQEVLVAYLQGDPERPTIVGRVYNARNPLPVDTTAHPEQSTVRTETTTNVDGFNELRFDDRAGEEQVFLHAQRDLVEVVEHDHSTTVERDQQNRAGRHRTHEVGGDEAITVTGKQVIQVDGRQEQVVAKDRIHKVNGKETVTVVGDRQTSLQSAEVHDVAAGRTVSVGADHAVRAGGSYTSSAAADHAFESTNMTVAASSTFGVTSKTASLSQTDSFLLTVGSATIEVKPGLIRLDNGAGAWMALVGGKVLVSAGATMELTASGELTAIGAKIHLNP